MSSPNPILVAAAPSLENVLVAVQTFITNLGTDPLQVAAKFPGAVTVFLGTVEMQAPLLATSEFAAAQTMVNSKINAWLASLKALSAPPTLPASPPA